MTNDDMPDEIKAMAIDKYFIASEPHKWENAKDWKVDDRRTITEGLPISRNLENVIN